MKFSIIHPSRSRPEQAYETFKKWAYSATHTFEYLLSIDQDDPLFRDYIELFDNQGIIVNSNNKSAIQAINNAATQSTGDVIITISDDFDCPDRWDTLLTNELTGKYDFVLKTKDGIQKTLVTLPILDRCYYSRYGYIYHPDFYHMGADCELTAVALMTGKLLYSDLEFQHLHYSVGKSQKDAINEKNDLTYQHGDRVLADHLKNNFGIEKPLIQYNQIQWH